jgi:RNA polymerase sigma-70 factor (ECF subfamily)
MSLKFIAVSASARGESQLPLKTKELLESFEKEALIHLDSLYNSALKMSRSEAEAEDLVQETFLRAYKSFNRFESGTNCKAWLFKIMTNIFINRYNRHKTGPEMINYEDIEDYYICPATSNPDYVQNRHYKAEWIFVNLFDDNIQNLLRELPDEFRLSIILSDIQGFTYADVAEITDVKIGTVKSRLFRARKKLQKGLWEWAMANGYALEV